MLKKKKTTASGKLVLVKSVRRTRSHRMKFCVQRGLGALPSTSKRRGKSQRDFLLCGPVCINTGIACLFSPKMKRTSERIVKFHSLAQVVSNFSDNSVSSFTVSWVLQQGVTHFWRTAGIKHFHLIDTLILQRNIFPFSILAICFTETWLRSESSCCVSSLFFRASRIFALKQLNHQSA